MKELEALGWKRNWRGHPTRSYRSNTHDVVDLEIFNLIGAYRLTPIIRGKSGFYEDFPTLDLTLNAANALACCTPENPKGRWVE